MSKNTKKKYEFLDVPIERIRPSKDNPRKTFDTESINNLAGSLGEIGEMEEISVRNVGKGLFELINGERRLRAQKELGTKTLRVKAYVIDEIGAGVMRLNEGEPLNQLEKEAAIYELWEAGLKAGKWKTQAEFARKIQQNEATVKRIIAAVKERTLVASFSDVPAQVLEATRTLEPNVRDVIIEQYKTGDTPKTGEVFRKTIRDIKEAPEDLQIQIAKREITPEDAKTTEALETIAPEARRELLALRKSDSISSKELSARVEALKEAPSDLVELIVSGQLAPDTATTISRIPSKEGRAKFVKEAALVKRVQEREVALHTQEIEHAAEAEERGERPEPTTIDVKRDIARVENDNWMVSTLNKLHIDALAIVRTDFLRKVSEPAKANTCYWYIEDIANICQRILAERSLSVQMIEEGV